MELSGIAIIGIQTGIALGIWCHCRNWSGLPLRELELQTRY